MKPFQIYDAVIIGAGPAGLMAARELMRKDLNFRILDASRQIGYPLKCAEITRTETFSELLNRLDYPFVKNRIARVSFQTVSTQRQIVKEFLMLDKPGFLQWLAAPIADKLMLDTAAAGIKKQTNALEIVTNRGTLLTRLAILAVGNNYKIQQEFGLLKKNVELIPCIGGFFKNDTLASDTAYLFYNEETYTAVWCFPKGNQIVNAGAGIILENARTKKLNLATVFGQTLKRFRIPLEGKPSFFGRFVTNGPIARTYADRLLVCGDSAGQVFAGIGEGIYFALKAGQVAGQTAVRAIENGAFQSEFLKEFEIQWKKSLGRHMHAGVIFATLLFFLMRNHLTSKSLAMIKPEEIYDIWINGVVSLRLRIFYSLLRLSGCAPKR